jgi:hypothetical protein
MAEQTVLEHLYTAELNEAYYRALAARASLKDRSVQVASALTSLGAVAVWISSQSPGLQKAWTILLLVSAALSAVSPIVRWFDDAVKFTNFSSRWSAIAGKLRVLKLSAVDASAERTELLRIVDTMEALQSEDTLDPRSGLITKLQDRIVARHQLGPKSKALAPT